MSKPLDRMTPEELGKLFPIILVAHDPAWARHFKEEKEVIQEVLGPDRVHRIEHIGSTAIPGIRAKPSIDILLEVPDNTGDDQIRQGLQGIGYHFIHRPENPPPGMMFVKGYTEQGFRGQPFHIHVRYPGDWEEIGFRDYLLAHPGEARAYEALKERLAQEFRKDRDGYTEAKTDFIKQIMHKASFFGSGNSK
jgi:GrpB-like predicted nucleotidyltransferase (UPF0157 family)